VYQFAKALSEHLLPRMTAYHEIWLDKKLVAGDAIKEQEPLYGPYYLPRKVRAFHHVQYLSPNTLDSSKLQLQCLRTTTLTSSQMMSGLLQLLRLKVPLSGSMSLLVEAWASPTPTRRHTLAQQTSLDSVHQNKRWMSRGTF
jgi:hypothetical protein